jgi:hypothetical protein
VNQSCKGGKSSDFKISLAYVWSHPLNKVTKKFRLFPQDFVEKSTQEEEEEEP